METNVSNTDNGHLLLLHLSDLHFEEPYCLDTDSDVDHPVRTALMNDVEELVGKLGNVDAILISGDIAKKGHPDEYATAKIWLAELARIIGCPESSTYPVPGNHDVCRIIAKSRLVEGVRSTITKKAAGHARDTELQKALREEQARNDLLSPMKEYNVFAASFGCDLTGNNPFWKHELPLSGGWKLVMHGLSSTLFSGPEDDKERDNLYLGALQCSFPPDKGIIRLAMLHHPHDWLKDCDAVDDSFNNGCELHLIGHKHKQRYLPTKSWIRLAAGAVNPARADGTWEPGYNLIKLQIIEREGEPTLQVDSYQRKWQGSPDQFVAKQTVDKKDVFTDYIHLRRPPSPATPTITAGSIPIKTTDSISSTPEALMDELSYRELVMKFWKLSTTERWRVTYSLGLLDKEAGAVPETIRYRQVFDKAREQDKMEDLRQKIEESLK